MSLQTVSNDRQHGCIRHKYIILHLYAWITCVSSKKNCLESFPSKGPGGPPEGKIIIYFKLNLP